MTLSLSFALTIDDNLSKPLVYFTFLSEYLFIFILAVICSVTITTFLSFRQFLKGWHDNDDETDKMVVGL